MKTAIMTDSNSGIFPEEGRQLGVYVQPMPVLLDGKEYFEGVNLTREEFYQKLRDDADVSTSQPAPSEVADTWQRIFADGYDELVYIPMSSGISSSFATAKALSADFGGRVKVVDNHSISVILRNTVLDAKAMADQGRSAEEIQRVLEAPAAVESVIYLGVDTLKYFKKNGRCTAATAALSTVLNIKPLLKCEGERFEAVAKIRGTEHCQRKELEIAREAFDALRQGGGQFHIGAGSSFENPDDEKRWAEEVQAAFPESVVHYDPLSFSVVCHTGLNAFGMGICRKKY